MLKKTRKKEMNQFQVKFFYGKYIVKTKEIFFFREIDFVLDFTNFFWPGFCF